MKVTDSGFKSDLGYFHQDIVRYILGLFILGRGAKYFLDNISPAYIALGVLMLAGDLIIFFAHRKIEVSFDNLSYRYAYSIFGKIDINLMWQKLPEPEYISVLKELKAPEIDMSIVYSGKKKIKLAEFKDIEAALAMASFFARKLNNVRVLNATSRPFVWLNENE